MLISNIKLVDNGMVWNTSLHPRSESEEIVCNYSLVLLKKEKKERQLNMSLK
jgi:hypothetical protein